MISKRTVILIISLSFFVSQNAFAVLYTQSPEAIVGSGANSATIAVDFDVDNSFIFTYQWDGIATGHDALMAIVDDISANLEAVTAFGGTFLVDLIYPGGVKYDYGIDNTGWVYYTSEDGTNWDYSMVGFIDRDLTDNCWDSWTWSNFSSDWMETYRTPGAVPTAAPEPATLALFGLGAFLFRRKLI